MRRQTSRLAKIFLLMVLVFVPRLAVASDGPQILLNGPEGVRERVDPASLVEVAEARGPLRVIVGFEAGSAMTVALDEVGLAHQTERVADERARIVVSAGLGELRNYGAFPYFAVTATAEQLRRLAAIPGITSIAEVMQVSPSLDSSVVRINAPRLWARRFIGTGQTVAVIDTGVATNHLAFRGRIAGEYCASGDTGPRQFCTPRSSAPGSGGACPADISGCLHGTHVAGIVAGALPVSGEQPRLRGVAFGARVLAIQAFRRVEDCGDNPRPCLRALDEDLLDAVFYATTTPGVTSINLSLNDSSTGYTGFCDSRNPHMTDAFRYAAVLGIAVVVSAGNRLREDQVEWPACISHVIAVGSSTRDSGRSEGVYFESNNGPRVDLLAPGVAILAPVPPPAAAAQGRGASMPSSRDVGRLTGTSMAAPHVAGAIALLRSAVPGVSLDHLRSALVCSGRQIARRYTNQGTWSSTRPRPRIDVAAARNWLLNPEAIDCTTTIGLTVAPSPAGVSRRVTLTAAVSAAVGEPQGWVEFFDGDTLLGRARVSSSGRRITQLEAGREHTCGLDETGQVWCWGRNWEGQLGDGTDHHRNAPIPVQGLTDATAIAAGTSRSCAIRAGGAAVCWGGGYVGDGTTERRLTPVAVQGLNDAVAIAVGGLHSCALRADGTVACWGSNERGQLGDGTTDDRLTPEAVQGLTDVTAITLGMFHSCARRAGGVVACWGANSDGQLGDGTDQTRLVPVAVTGLRGVTAIAAGDWHTCGRRVGGRVVCWGSGRYAALGRPGGGSAPGRVQRLADATAIAAGGHHNCALRTGGAVTCWGWNWGGQLGNDSTVYSSSIPVAVLGLTDATAVTAGFWHSCALRRGGAVACWGYNEFGQLGDATHQQRQSPVAVPLGQVMQAVLRTSFLLPGTRALTAAFVGSASHAASLSPTLSHQVLP